MYQEGNTHQGSNDAGVESEVNDHRSDTSGLLRLAKSSRGHLRKW